MRDWVFVTSSREKVVEAERILGRKLLHENLDLPEIQSLKLEEVIAKKAEWAYDRLGHQPVIVEDTALFVSSWHGLPGPLIRWFEETVGPEGICLMLAGFPERNARAQTMVAAHDGSLKLFSGDVSGRIVDSPRGEYGFGWDKIFVPDGETRTFGEMAPHEKDQLSMRMKALQDFANAEKIRP